jgi:hypothetical protein
MRTTIILPDELYRQVKERARAEDRTFTSFLEEAVRAALADGAMKPARAKADVFLAPPSGGSGVRPGVELDDNAALADLLDEEDFTVRTVRDHPQAKRGMRG